MGSDVLLTFNNVRKVFGNNVVIDDASFYIKKGEIFGFVGKSGCGKSTLVKIMLGIHSPTSGEIFFGNKNILNSLKNLRENVGFVSQDNSLFMELTLRENCKYFSDLYDVSNIMFEKRFKQLSKLLNFDSVSDLPLSAFSGGMVKRANILASLIHDPKVLILDEPTVGLDSILRENLWEYIRELNKKEDITIFLITHLLDEVEENCSRVGILKAGKVVAFSEMKNYKKAYNNKHFKEIFKEIMKDENL